jgi:hypothetical protein
MPLRGIIVIEILINIYPELRRCEIKEYPQAYSWFYIIVNHCG